MNPGIKLLVSDRGALQQYVTPEEINTVPANEYIKKLAEKAG